MLQDLGPNARRPDLSENQILPPDPASLSTLKSANLAQLFPTLLNPISIPFQSHFHPGFVPGFRNSNLNSDSQLVQVALESYGHTFYQITRLLPRNAL